MTRVLELKPNALDNKKRIRSIQDPIIEPSNKVSVPICFINELSKFIICYEIV